MRGLSLSDMLRKHYPDVDAVVDAKKRVVLNITREDIAFGKRKDHRTCGVAVCVRRQENVDGVIVGVRRVYFIKGRVATRFEPTESLSRELVAFDRGGTFDAGVYVLNPVRRPTGTKTRRTRTPSEASSNPGGSSPQLALSHFTRLTRTTLGGGGTIYVDERKGK